MSIGSGISCCMPVVSIRRWCSLPYFAGSSSLYVLTPNLSTTLKGPKNWSASFLVARSIANAFRGYHNLAHNREVHVLPLLVVLGSYMVFLLSRSRLMLRLATLLAASPPVKARTWSNGEDFVVTFGASLRVACAPKFLAIAVSFAVTGPATLIALAEEAVILVDRHHFFLF